MIDAPAGTLENETIGKATVSWVGKVVDGKYKILEQLGRGGTGVVYKAEHVMINRTVAVKVLHQHLVENEDSLKRFQHEAKVASRLSHPNAVLLYDFGIWQSYPYLVMQYVAGQTLKQVIREQGALPIAETCQIFEQACAALGEAHRLGIIHRDLKPENIMITRNDDGTRKVLVLDFGIAKLLLQGGEKAATVVTQEGLFYGTPQYASPEQVLSKELDVRSDIYSLGIVLYESLSGDLPFDAPSLMEVLFKQLNEIPPALRDKKPPLPVSKAVDDVVLKSLQKDPAKRYQTVKDLLEDLQRAANIKGEKGTKKAGSSRLKVVGAVVCVLVVVGGVLIWHEQNAEEGAGLAKLFHSLALVPKEKEAPAEHPKATGWNVSPPALVEEPRPREVPVTAPAETQLAVKQEKSPQDAATTQPAAQEISKPAPSALVLRSEPPGAEVYLDQALRGVTPLTVSDLEARQFQVVMKLKDYEDYSGSVTTEAGKEAAVDAPLKKLTVPDSQVRADDAEKTFHEGERLYTAKQYLPASKELEKAVEIRASHIKARLLLGVCYLRLGKRKEAYDQFTAAAKLDTNYAPVHYNFACYYAVQGETNKALDELERSIHLSPRSRAWALHEPDLDSLRANARFQKLVVRAGY